MSEQFSEIANGIAATQLAGVDQAHVQITDLSTLQGLVEKTVFPVQNCFFQCPLRDIVVQGSLHHVRKKYACLGCERVGENPQMEVAAKPEAAIEKGMAGPGLLAFIVATDDTIMPMQSVGKVKSARMWVYVGDAGNPYNVFSFTLNRGRDGPKYFLQDYQHVLLADGYGGYDGVVVGNQITRAGCWVPCTQEDH
jgi:Transposase IS66 family